MIDAELEIYRSRTMRSMEQTARARHSLPKGVPSSFQAYDPHPVVAARARGSWIEDLDGNHYVDFNMGFGALFSGHGHPIIVDAIQRQLLDGTLFVTPCELNADVAEALQDRFAVDLVRFTNSGTEATMDAIRVARGFTGRDKMVKVEGGYHGHHDEVMISMKPPLHAAGDPLAPTAVPATLGLTDAVLHDTIVIPYNNPEALERVLARGDVAAFIVEPAMENIGICLPDPGYLQLVRQLCDRYGTLLIFDEVKTGITAAWGGATGYFGVQPDLLALAKSIGGGYPIGAFAGRRDVMDMITTGDVLHLGTYNGNPLVMAAANATLREVCTPEATALAVAKNTDVVSRIQAIIDAHDLPAHTVQLGAKGCVTWCRSAVRNYRDYKATDFDLAYAQWIHGINRGILLPPGLDEQWLISVMHTRADCDHAVEVFDHFVQELLR
ncbi:MAG: aspartate aminotransferase family protein [Acidimicrobiia bacterium]